MADRTESIFAAAVALTSGTERTALLDRECAEDPELRRRIEALLQAHDQAGHLLDQPAADLLPATAENAGVKDEFTPAFAETNIAEPAETTDYRGKVEAGTVVGGRYTLREKIGEGGMGEVWAAKQSEPVKRKVALKLIKLGMDSRSVVTRFEQERQALAMMDHPNIARVLDGGLTAGGQPFFVMELVNGLPLTRFCDEAKLSTKQRLDLFLPVCQAVQHAHQKGIVHRDLKPANILVTMIDGRPVPKVIDFGVAKATSGRLIEESLSTQFGAIVGTLEYMSPEQAGFASDDIDTRADIYSLGVILYELLTGLRPHDGKRLRQAALTEMIRIIRDEEPSKPSTRLSTDESLPSLAAVRQTDPKHLPRLLRGELDWVVMKCLEKQRDRRYETANGLARDLQHYLSDEPVEARPPSTGYRLQKFLKRNKGPAVAAALVVLTLLAGITGTTFGFIQADQQRQEAETARQAEAERAEGEAKERLRAEAGEKLAKQQRAKAEKAYARTADVLDSMVSEVTADSLTTQKTITPEQKKFLAEVLMYYREFAEVKADDEKSRLRTAHAAFRVGGIEYRLGRKQEAAAAIRQALDAYAALSADYPSTGKYREALASCHVNQAVALNELGKLQEAEKEYRLALAILEKLVPEFPTAHSINVLVDIHNNMGLLLKSRGMLREAEEQHRLTLAMRKKLATDFPTNSQYRSNLAISHNHLGILLDDLGKRSEAVEHFRKGLDIQQKLVAEFPSVAEYRRVLAAGYHNLATLLRDMGKPLEAVEQFRKALSIKEKLAAEFPSKPEYHRELAASRNNLAAIFYAIGKHPESLEQFRQALIILRNLATEFPAVAENRHDLAASHFNLAILLNGMRKRQEAEEQYRLALPIRKKLAAEFPSVPEYRRELAATHDNLGILLMGLGKRPEAEAQLRDAMAVKEKLAAEFPTNSRFRVGLGGNYCNFGTLMRTGGKTSESVKWYAKAIGTLTPIYEREPGNATARNFLRNSHYGRAMAYAGLQQHPKAIPDWDKAIELSSKPRQNVFRAMRTTSLHVAGNVAKAVAEVAELTKAQSWPYPVWYNFACVYCVASNKFPDKKKEYADRAMECLQKAVKGGFKDADHLGKDTDLDPLRDRDDFKKLVKPLRGGSTPCCASSHSGVFCASSRHVSVAEI